jgi:hypothetical protein
MEFGEISPSPKSTSFIVVFGGGWDGQGFETKNNSVKKSRPHQNKFQSVLRKKEKTYLQTFFSSKQVRRTL